MPKQLFLMEMLLRCVDFKAVYNIYTLLHGIRMKAKLSIPSRGKFGNFESGVRYKVES